MKKYLIVIKEDVADEGDVGLVKVVNEDQLSRIKTIRTGFGNIEGDTLKFNRSSATELTNEDFQVLEKLKLTDLRFGTCFLEDENDEDIDW